MDRREAHQNPYPYDTTRVTELLKRKRRVRGIKSCFPCRHRKVKCDGNFPCETCVLRGHPEICCAPSSETNNAAQAERVVANLGQTSRQDANDAEYSMPQDDGNVRSNSNTPNSFSQPQPSGIDLMIKRLEDIESQISALKKDLQQTRSSVTATPDQESSRDKSSRFQQTRDAQSLGNNFVEESTGATIFLGHHSDPPAALGCRKVVGDTIIPDALLLDQVMPRTYPFTSLWGPDADAAEICGTLPDDSNVIRYWQTYQTSVYPFYPALVQHEEFSDLLFKFLDRRAETISAGEALKAEDVDASWLALLFAVLACGVQFSDDPVKERDLQSKVFVCSSFQCLRLSDFFTNTDMNQIQAMALIGHCLRNNLDANSAWILMGATMRLAQSIGLHETSSSDSSSASVVDFQKRRLWWVLVWQDVFLSFTYDRSPSTVKPSSGIPYNDISRGEKGNCSFAECIFTLVQLILERSRDDNAQTMAVMMGYKVRLEAILSEEVAAPFLREKPRCRTLQDHLERLALRVHICYVITRFCRLMLEMTPDETQPMNFQEILKQECIDRATEAVKSFLDMHRLSSLVCRSWAFVHNAVSCAFALQSLGATEIHASRASSIIGRLVVVLDHEEAQATWEDFDTNVRYFGPYSRASKALKEAIASRI